MNIISYVKQPLVFHVLKEAVKYIETSTENVSPESFYSLWQLLPAMKLPLSGPLRGWVNINQAMSTFSTPLSPRTLEGNPKTSTASRNSLRTVWALLSQLHLRYVIWREYPSIPPWTTKPHLRIQTKVVSRSYNNKWFIVPCMPG